MRPPPCRQLPLDRLRRVSDLLRLGLHTACTDSGASFSRSLNLDIPSAFGYTGLACGMVGAADGADCAVAYKAGAVVRLKRFASADVK